MSLVPWAAASVGRAGTTKLGRGQHRRVPEAGATWCVPANARAGQAVPGSGRRRPAGGRWCVHRPAVPAGDGPPAPSPASAGSRSAVFPVFPVFLLSGLPPHPAAAPRQGSRSGQRRVRSSRHRQRRSIRRGIHSRRWCSTCWTECRGCRTLSGPRRNRSRCWCYKPLYPGSRGCRRCSTDCSGCSCCRTASGRHHSHRFRCCTPGCSGSPGCRWCSTECSGCSCCRTASGPRGSHSFRCCTPGCRGSPGCCRCSTHCSRCRRCRTLSGQPGRCRCRRSRPAPQDTGCNWGRSGWGRSGC